MQGLEAERAGDRDAVRREREGRDGVRGRSWWRRGGGRFLR